MDNSYDCGPWELVYEDKFGLRVYQNKAWTCACLSENSNPGDPPSEAVAYQQRETCYVS